MTKDQPEPHHAAEWQNVTVRYPFAEASAVGPISLTIRPGERVLLLGPSGSGKSTLLLTLTGLIPRTIPALVNGTIKVHGEDATSREPWGWVGDVAHLFQDADKTVCGMRVEDEIAFALENRAMDPLRIETAITSAMEQVGLPESWRLRRTSTLSGGERQLVALAATLIQGAGLFAGDEPTAHLAPEAASRLRTLLETHHADRTVLIVDHRLDGLVTLIDRVVVIGAEGSLIAQGDPRSVFRENCARLKDEGIWRPAASDLDAALLQTGVPAPVPPLSVAEALAHLDPAAAPRAAIGTARPCVEAFVADGLPPCRGADGLDAPVLVRLEEAACAPYLGPIVLRDINLSIRKGEIVGILGPNGAGKSTLGRALAGLLPLMSGQRTGPTGGYSFQHAESQFTMGSVREELTSVLRWSRVRPEAHDQVVAETLRHWGLSSLAYQHPHELSQGEKRRLALAMLSMTDRWPLLVLDEPTAGLDAGGVARLVTDLERMSQSERAIALITHDMDLALRLCPRCVVVGEGGLLAEGPTGKLLSDPSLLARSGLAEPSRAAAARWLTRVSQC